MSAELITNLISVGPLGTGGVTTLPHGIRTNNLGPTIPNIIVPNRSTGIVVTSVTTTAITFTNAGTVDGDSAIFLVEYIHSYQNGVPGLHWWWQGGPVGSGIGTAMRLDSISTDNLQAYVDGVNGNDNNDGLTPATALQTVGAVYRKFPVLTIDGARLTINIAGVGGFGASATARLTYTESTLLAGGGMSFSNSYKYKCADMVHVTPATGPATAAFDAVPATVSGKRTTLAFTTAAPGWTAHDLQGQFARILRAGVPVFAEIPIADNTTNQVFIDTAGIVGVVLNTDTFEIVEPSVLVIGIDDGPFTGTFMTKIQGTGAGTAYNDAFTQNQEPMTFERMAFGGDQFGGVYLDSNGGVGFDRCSFNGSAGSWFRGLGVALTNTVVEYTMYWGCSSADDETVPNFAPGTINKTVFVQLMLHNGPLLVGGITTNGLGATSFGYFCAQRNVSVYQAGAFVGAAIHVGPNSVFYMDAVGSPDTGYDGALQGSNTNASVAIRCIDGGKARIGSNTGGLTTISGSGSPLQCDSAAAIAYGVGAGQFEEAAGYNGNFTFKNAGTAAAPLGDGGTRIFTSAI